MIVLNIIAWLCIVAATVLEATTHGLRWRVQTELSKAKADKYNRLWHKTNALFLAFLVVGVWLTGLGSNYVFTNNLEPQFFFDMLFIAGNYVLIRFALFNYVNNLTKGIYFFYYGNTSFSDRFYTRYIARFINPGMMFFVKLFALVVSFINYL
jgi:hypothetical protein